MTMKDRLRLIIVTAGPLTPINSVFFEHLARDPLFELAGIVIDDYQRPRKPLLRRIARSLREEGVGWLAFKLGAKLRAMVRAAACPFIDFVHGRSLTEESYEALAERTRIP